MVVDQKSRCSGRQAPGWGQKGHIRLRDYPAKVYCGGELSLSRCFWFEIPHIQWLAGRVCDQRETACPKGSCILVGDLHSSAVHASHSRLKFDWLRGEEWLVTIILIKAPRICKDEKRCGRVAQQVSGQDDKVVVAKQD